MTLSELIDVEVQLARDRAADPGVLEARDRALLAAGQRSGSRAIVLRRWLAALRAQDGTLRQPGRTVESSVRAVRLGLVVLGLVLGWGAATAVLEFTGDHPVNVWDFLLVFVGLQLALLLLLAASIVLPVRGAGAPLFAAIRAAVRAVHRRLAARDLPRAASAEEWGVIWHTLRARRSLYRAVEPWLVLVLTQSFAVAFNVAALAACLRLVVFSDLAFSWSTTLLELDGARFHALVRALAAPWGWAWPDAVPSSALVAATRYSRLEGAYLVSGAGRAAQGVVAGGWWPFLVAALCGYGLLPRAVLLAVARFRVSRLLARFPLDDPEVSRLVERLTAPDVQTRGARDEAVRPEGPAAASEAKAPPAGTPRRCVTILWRDVPAGDALRSAVARHVRCGVSAVEVAGGRDYDEGRVDWQRVIDGTDAVIVVAEGWEPPDRSVLRLVRKLRSALGAGRGVRVLLVGPSDGDRVAAATSDDVRLWRDGLARLADPYVAVEPLREAS